MAFDRLKRWLYHVKTYSFNRGETIELDLEDDLVEFLFSSGWVYQKNGEFYFSRKGHDDLVAFCNTVLEKNEHRSNPS